MGRHRPTGYAALVLELGIGARDTMVAHCLASLPYEGCGLLVGDPETSIVEVVVATRNVAASALIYEVDPAEHLRADRAARASGREVVGAFHSHTHTDAWPSATDVAAAVDPAWHWVIVSLRHPTALVRSFVITEGRIDEEPVRVH